jgi:hypothetical protein
MFSRIEPLLCTNHMKRRRGEKVAARRIMRGKAERRSCCLRSIQIGSQRMSSALRGFAEIAIKSAHHPPALGR